MTVSNGDEGEDTVDGPGDQSGQGPTSAIPKRYEEPGAIYIPAPGIKAPARRDDPADNDQADHSAGDAAPTPTADYLVIRLTLAVPNNKHKELIAGLPSYVHFVQAQILDGDDWRRTYPQ